MGTTMGPIALFDKSFLQSLTLDESVWFDHFFHTNVCPIFYVETLADLGKEGTQQRNSTDDVRIIADKFPDTNSGQCALHTDLSLDNLIGYDVPMTGQVPLASGRLVSIDGKPNIISDGSPVADVFNRWQDAEFDVGENKFAKTLRDQLSKINLAEKPEILDIWATFQQPCKSLAQAHSLAINFIKSTQAPLLRLEICLTLLQVPKNLETKIRLRWVKLGYPSISIFAPYAAFVISIIIFFHLAVKSGQISPDRVSNLTDFAYLFYLPFCMVFVSSDRLHKRVAPLFLRDNQELVWGPDLKSALQEINLYYSLFPDVDKQKGIYALAPIPPQHIPTLVSHLWDRHLPTWRNRKPKELNTNAKNRLGEIQDKVKQMEKAPTLKVEPETFQIDDIQSATIKRKIRAKRGSWLRIPKDSGN